MSKLHLMIAATAFLLCFRAQGVQCGTLPIGPTKIPFYSGNLSVIRFMMQMGTSNGPIPLSDWASPECIELLKRTSCFADCDYQSWALAEPEKGQWDFSVYAKNADLLRNSGLDYVCFAWLHFPPKWFLSTPDFVPYQCVEHGGKLMQLSPWAPKVWDVFRGFYKAQHEAMGEKIRWIRLATPSDYGEIGFPAAMTSWLVPQEHAHAGYWCGDPYARADFRAEMRRRFRSIGTLNKRWGTAFETWKDVTYPDLVQQKAARVARESGKPTDRRRWLDFIEWYYGTWLRFVPKFASVVREFYPETPLIVSVGYASELTMVGNDYSAIPKMAKQSNIALQSPGNVGYYALKRVSTACHFYGCPYYTEPPGDVPPEAEIARVWSDVSNGVQVYFEYAVNLDLARPQLRMYKDHMTGARPVVDVAVFNPTIEHRINCGADNFPVHAYNLCENGRDIFDCDVVDESLIRDGALKDYRILVYTQGNVTEDLALDKIAAWVRQGGVLLTCELGDVESVEGSKSTWQSLVPSPLLDKERVGEVQSDGKWDWAKVTALCTKRIGRGLVIRLPVKPDAYGVFAEAVAHAAYNLTDFGSRFRNAPLIDAVRDEVKATLLPDRILYFNGTDREIVKHVTLRPEDWAARPKKPEKTEYDLTLRPHSIAAVLLR